MGNSFLFLRWQELKREETEKRGIAKTPPIFPAVLL